MTSTSSPSLKASREAVSRTSSGYLMLVILLAVIVVGGFLIFAPKAGAAAVLGVGLCALLFLLIIKGFYVLQPNQAAAILLFGSYQGTDRATGLRWVWPWMSKTK